LNYESNSKNNLTFNLTIIMELENMDELKNLTLDQIAWKMHTMEELRDFLKWVTWPMIEKMLQSEMEEHLWYEKHSKKWYNSWNSRNWNYKKTLLTWNWKVDVEIPRDRNAEFEPKIVSKYQTKTSEVEEKIINMYWLWLTTSDIQNHIKDIYWSEISKDLISNITDKILPEIQEWQWRSLKSFYPIIYLDAIHFKIRDNSKVESKWVYIVLWINYTWNKEILGFYIWDSESASFWQWVCNNIYNRWVEDICIACIDWLSGFSNAIKNIYPDVEIQRCIIHQIRYSMQYISNNDSREFMKDLKSIYQATTFEIAEEALENLDKKWSKTYPISVNSWKKNWSELSTYFVYSHDLRKIIYTTNTIEWFNRQIRKVTKNRWVFPTKTSLEKLLYLATKNITKKWDMPIHNWWKILGQFDSFFPWKVEKHMIRN